MVPQKIFWLSLGIGSLSLYPLGEGISSLLLPPLHGQTLLPAPAVLLSLLTGSLSIWLSYQVRELKLSYGLVLTLLGLASLGSVLSGVFSFGSVVHLLTHLREVSHGSVLSRVVPLLSGGCTSIMLPGIVFYRFLFAHRLLKEHSPRHTKLFSQQPTFSIPIWRKDLSLFLILLLALTEVIFLSIFPLFP